MIRFSEKGFSSIEILITILLISFIFVACMLTYGTSMKTSSYNKFRNNAIRLAQQTVENLKQYDQSDYDRNSEIWKPTSPSYVLNTDKPPIDNIITYTVIKEIIPNSELDSNIKNDTNIIPIRITVKWDYQGQNSIVVNTYLMKWH